MNDGMTTLPHRDFTMSVSRREARGRLGTGALVIGVLASTQGGVVAAQATPPAGAVEAVARQAIEAVNAAMATGEMSAIDAIFARDVAGHPPHRSLVTGEPFSHDLAGLKASLADIRHFFPDAAMTIDDLITSGDTVAARVTFRGTPDAVAIGLGEKASQPLAIGGLMHGRIADGRVAGFLGLLRPGGIAPAGRDGNADGQFLIDPGHATRLATTSLSTRRRGSSLICRGAG